MLNIIFWITRFFNFIFRNKELKDVLNQNKKVKVKGVLFEIIKLDVSHYLNGSKSLITSWDTYHVGNADKPDVNVHKRIKEHFRDVFLAAVVKPVLTRKEDEKEVCVDEIFRDWDLANELYEHIMVFTYGKKKLKLLASQQRELQS